MIFVRLVVWFAVWIGGLIFAAQRYEACQNEGVMVASCDRTVEYLGWVVALVGLVMLARALHSIPVVRSWVSD